MERLEEVTELDILAGFKFLSAHSGYAKSSVNDKPVEDDYVITMTFANDKHVAIDIDIIEMEIHVGEPYAVDDNFEPVR